MFENIAYSWGNLMCVNEYQIKELRMFYAW